MKKIVTLVLILVCFTSITFAGALTATIEVVFNKVNIAVNGQKIEADNILYNGTTYVPLRKVAEILGKDITWDAMTNTAGINDKVPSSVSALTNDAGNGFAFKNISFKSSEGSPFTTIIGEMTNKSGKDYKTAGYTISLYGESGKLLEVNQFYIDNFKNSDTKSFDDMLTVDITQIRSYKIQFESGY